MYLAKIVKAERNTKKSSLFFIAEAHPMLLKDSESRFFSTANPMLFPRQNKKSVAPAKVLHFLTV